MIGKNIDLLDEVEPDGGVCDGEDAQGDPVGCFIFHTISIKPIEGNYKLKNGVTHRGAGFPPL